MGPGPAATELALLRIVAQRLAGPRFTKPLEAVRHLGAVQGQDLPGALASVALRVDGGTRDDVHASLDSADIVRSWPMRGTLHLVPGVDLRWMLAITAPRMLRSATARRRELGIDDATRERAGQVAHGLITGGAVRRAQLFEAWAAADLLHHPQTGSHLLAELCQTARLVLGPLRGTEQLIAVLDEHVPHRVNLDREAGLAELARRFLTSHGPATDRDLARWASLTLTDARAGIEGARSHLEAIEIDGVEHLMAPGLPDLLAEHRTEARRMMLLPGFDELMLGYVDRGYLVPRPHLDRVVPGNNGMFRPTMVKNGTAIGTWRRPSRSGGAFVPEPFGAFGPRLQSAAASVFAALP